MKLSLPLLSAALALAATGCRRDMADQPKLEAFEASSFFADGAASRPLPAHTIARGALRADDLLFRAQTAEGKLADTFPMPIGRPELERGRERYDIYCSPCHGRTGDGRGMIAQRGFPPPPTFHQARLREAPVGHIFEVITNGYGIMYPYASRVTPEDRWAIAAYIRALQLSENATLADVDPGARAQLEGQAP